MLEVIRKGEGCNADRMAKVVWIGMHRSDAGREYLRVEAIDSIVDFLREAPDLKHLPKSVDAWVSRSDWPNNCPRKSGVLTRDSFYSFRERREYCFTNEPSGKEFQVRLEFNTDDNCFNEITLLF